MANNIRKLPSGSYQVRMQKDGKSHNGTFATKKEAQIFIAEVHTEKSTKSVKPITVVKTDIPTFKNLWEKYQLGEFWTGKKETTKKRELQCIPFILAKIGDTPINQIGKTTISQYKLDRSNETYKRKGVHTAYSGTAIRLEMCLMSAIFSYCLGQHTELYQEWMVINPCLGVAKPPTVSRIVRVDNTDYLKILAYLEQHQEERTGVFLKFMLQIALHTGMRVSEIGRMQWDHVKRDVNTNTLSILVPISKNQEKRSIPISKALGRVLKDVWTFRNYPDLYASESRFIFWSKTKKGIYRPYEPAQYLNRIRVKLNIEQPISFHHFRHEYISKLYETNLYSDALISRWTGHKTLQVLNKYAHFGDAKALFIDPEGDAPDDDLLQIYGN